MPVSPFVNNLRGVLDQAREIGGNLGLRQYQITFVSELWTGDGAGSDTPDGYMPTMLSRTVIPIKVGINNVDPPTRVISQKEVLQSGGLYQDKDIIVKFAKPFANSRQARVFDIADFDPISPSNETHYQVYWIVNGPDNKQGMIYQRVANNTSKNLGFEITLRNTGRQYVQI